MTTCRIYAERFFEKAFFSCKVFFDEKNLKNNQKMLSQIFTEKIEKIRLVCNFKVPFSVPFPYSIVPFPKSIVPFFYSPFFIVPFPKTKVPFCF